MKNNSYSYSAPGRCGIIGNPSDMYGGSVISCSTSERAVVMLKPHDRMMFRVGDEVYCPEKRSDYRQTNGPFDIMLAAIEYFDMYDEKLSIEVTSDIPFRGGLSGSTAILAALVGCILEYSGKWPLPLHMVAETVRYIELYFMKVVCGYQDAYMCTFGSLNFLDFRDKEHYRTLTREPLGTVERLAMEDGNFPFILAHTGIKTRISGAVHKPIRDRWLDGEELVRKAYLRLGHIARMAKRHILQKDWGQLGELMTENHEISRQLGGSGPENEHLIETALESGAIASKLAGAGKGGTIIALHPQPETLAKPLKKSGAERILYPSPSDGLRREKYE